MKTVVSVGDLIRRKSMLLLDGDFPWGAVVSGSTRHGAFQQRLVVYPPGISRGDRRWLRVWRGWTIWGGLLWIASQILVSQAINPWHSLAVSSIICLLAGVAAFVKAGPARLQVRTLNSCILPGIGHEDMLVAQRKLRLLASTLVTADAKYRRSELSMVEYEQIWWLVYDAMAPESDSEPDRRANDTPSSRKD